jgi:lactate dehydrogenase-like 2-hydroxyacid dehydrogenase
VTRVALVDPQVRAGFVTVLRERLPAGWELVEAPDGATVVVTESVDVGPDLVARAGPNLRLVAKLDTGTARLDVGAVPTLHLPNVALVGVAEHTVALILASVRRLAAVDARTRARAYLPDRSEPKLTNQTDYAYNWIGLEDFGTLYGRTVGLVGLGYIGRAVAERLRAFGVKLRYTQRTRLPVEDEVALGVSYLPFDDLLAASDVVSLHHRFHEGEGGNDAQFGRDAFATMKRGAVFVNTARGRLVDEDALADALTSGHVGAAALDVFRYEPLPAGHPFLSIPSSRLLLTPHVAGGPIAEAWQLMADGIIERTTTLMEEKDHG